MNLAPLFASASDSWATPLQLFKALDAEFHFNFDPCPLNGTTDGRSPLFSDWVNKRVFCNPPYGPEIPKFLKRWLETEIAVYLVPARTDTRWFHEIVLPYAKEIRFIKGRLRFNDNPDPLARAPFPSMIVIFEGEGTKEQA